MADVRTVKLEVLVAHQYEGVQYQPGDVYESIGREADLQIGRAWAKLVSDDTPVAGGTPMPPDPIIREG